MITAYIVGGMITYAALIWAYCRYERAWFASAGDDIMAACFALIPSLLWPLAWVVGAVVFFIRRE